MPSHCPSSEHTSDDGNSPPRRKVRGKGRGGAGAKYCTMGPGERKEQFPGHPLSVRTNDLGIEVLWCDACGCPVSHTTKSTVQGHLDSKKHQAAVETMQTREKARVERRLEAEAEALPHKAAMRQPSLQSVVASCNDKNKAADDTVFAFAGASIPLDKLDHPLVRAWLQKYTTIAGCLPQGGSNFPKVNGQRVLDGHRGAIHKKTADRNTTLLFDEWTNERGVPVLAIIAHVGGRLKFCIDVAFLEGKGPQRGVEHKEIAGALLSSLATAQIHPDRINFVISDEGSTVVAAAKHVLQHVWRNARWFLCWSHKLAGIGDILRKHDVFSMIHLLYRSSSLVEVPMHSARRRRWRERSCLETVPPNIGDRDGHRGEMVLIGIVKIGRRGRTLWFWMLERRSATRRICPLCMRFTIASRSKE